MNVRVRKMTIRDYDAVVALWSGMAGIGLHGESDSRPAIRRYLKRNPGLSFVACAGREIAGAVLCGHDGRRGYLHHLAVSPVCRRRGIGRALVVCCLAGLARQGVVKCNIFLMRSNAGGKQFWRSIGWRGRSNLRLYQKASKKT